MYFRNGSTIWWSTLLTTLFTGVACRAVGFTLSRSSVIHLSTSVALGAILFYGRRFKQEFSQRIFHFVDGLLLISIIGTLGAVISYISMQQSGGLTDELLSRADHSLGFSWISIRNFVGRHPVLYAWLNMSYFACYLLPPVTIASLALTGRANRMYQFISAFGLSLLVTVLLEYYFPARAAFSYYAYQKVPPSAVDYATTIEALRNGSLTVIDLNNLSGIVTFPSFHAAMAILLGWAIWRVKIVRTLAIPLNFLMWCAAVPIGGHYVVDVIGGSAIAVGAILFVTRDWRRGVRGAFTSIAILPAFRIPWVSSTAPSQIR